MTFKETLDEVISAVKDLNLKEFGIISPTDILDVACRLTNTQKIESNKSFVSGKESKKDSDQPKATEKQVAFLVQLGYKGDVDNLSIGEAKRLIQDLKAKK